MPIVRQTINIDLDAEIEISVYCGICGEGVCGNTQVSKNGDTITVTCPGCESTIKDYEKTIDQLNDEIANLENELKEAK